MSSDWMNAERHAEQAQRFYDAGQWDLALDELRQALHYNPYQSDWHFGLGLTLDALRRYKEAARAFEQVLKLRGENVETLLHLGVDLIRSDQPREAVEVLERAAALDPDCEASYCHRIAAHSHLGEHETAELMFYLARQLVDECPSCYDHLAHSLALRGVYDRAIWCWQQALRLDRHYPDAHANLALAYWRRGEHDRARREFLRQLREEPGDVRSLLELGNLMVEMGQHAEASEKFRRALELDPALPEAHYLLGELALVAGHLDAAQSRFQHARELAPDRPGVHLGLAQVAWRRGQHAEAVMLAQAERRRHNQTAGQMLELARLFVELELPEEAVSLLTPILAGHAAPTLESDEHRATALLYRGVASMVVGRFDAGVADCRQALRLEPANLVAMQNLVLAHLETGRLARAAAWLRRAERLSPGHPELRQMRYRLRLARWTRFGRRWLQGVGMSGF